MAIEPLDLRDDAKDELMQLVRDTVATRRHEQHERQKQATFDALDGWASTVLGILEGAGLDIFAPLTTGVHADRPDHGWISSPHGLDFDIAQRGFGTFDSQFDCWALHPETHARVCRVTWQTTFDMIADAIVRADEATTDPFDTDPEPQDDPALVLLDALRCFIRSTDTPDHGGF